MYLCRAKNRICNVHGNQIRKKQQINNNLPPNKPGLRWVEWSETEQKARILHMEHIYQVLNGRHPQHCFAHFNTGNHTSVQHRYSIKLPGVQQSVLSDRSFDAYSNQVYSDVIYLCYNISDANTKMQLRAFINLN